MKIKHIEPPKIQIHQNNKENGDLTEKYKIRGSSWANIKEVFLQKHLLSKLENHIQENEEP